MLRASRIREEKTTEETNPEVLLLFRTKSDKSKGNHEQKFLKGGERVLGRRSRAWEGRGVDY
jgi:hypothetical protein